MLLLVLYFFFLGSRPLHQGWGEEGRVQIQGAWQCPVTTRASPGTPAVGAPPSVLGFNLGAPFYLAGKVLAPAPALTDCVKLGNFPSHPEPQFFFCKTKLTIPILFSRVRIPYGKEALAKHLTCLVLGQHHRNKERALGPSQRFRFRVCVI